ncbi:MAG: cellulase family glycosylhydrolase [Fibrobacterales bacterium]
MNYTHTIKAVLIVCIVSILLTATTVHSSGYLKREGTTIVNDEGSIILRGVNVGNWLFSEGYLMNIDTDGFKTPSEFRHRVKALLEDDTKAQEFFDAWRDNFFTEQDVISMQEVGINSYRILFQYKDIYDVDSGLLKPDGLNYLDSCAAWGKRHDVYMIFDMHGAPGGQNFMDHADVNLGDTEGITEPYKLFDGTDSDFDTYSDLAAEVWKAIAKHFVDESNIAYDLMNEPVMAIEKHEKLRTLMHKITDAIREVDTKHLIIVEGAQWASWPEALGDRWDDNMAVSTHNYWTEAPNSVRSNHINWAAQQDLPLWHGESGENSNVWYGLEIADLEEKGMGWSWWTFKKIKSVTGLYSCDENFKYKIVLDSWVHDSISITAEDAYAGLKAQATSMSSVNCSKNISVIDALFRKKFLTESVPYDNTPIQIPEIKIRKEKETLDSSVTILAEHYDMGTQGVAYFDTDFIQTNSDSLGNWNKGWVFRNDGVDITKSWGAHERGYMISHIEPGEWVTYTFEIVKAGEVEIEAYFSNLEAKTITLALNSDTLFHNAKIAPTKNWSDAESNTLGTHYFEKGTHTFTLFFESDEINFFRFHLTMLREEAHDSSGTSSIEDTFSSSNPEVSSSIVTEGSSSSTVESSIAALSFENPTDPLSSEVTAPIIDHSLAYTVIKRDKQLFITSMHPQGLLNITILNLFGSHIKAYSSNTKTVTIDTEYLVPGSYIALMNGALSQSFGFTVE